MIRVTVETDGAIGVAAEDGVCELHDAVRIFEQALKGCGYHFNGQLDFQEE